MRLSEARKLKRGDEVIVDDASGVRHQAKVIHATPKGGVKVEVEAGVAWVSYPHVDWPPEATFMRKVSKALFPK